MANTAVFVGGARILLAGLTPAGVAASWLLGTLAFSAFGAGGYALVCAYFVLGSAATRVRLEKKEALGIAEARSGRRGVGSVVGSGAAGAVCALAALALGAQHPWQLGFVASFTSKLSDTVSSEIGKAFGNTTYLVTSLQRVPAGTEGAVSAEGTAAGVAGAAGYAALAYGLGQVDGRGALLCALAATVTNIGESFLGATKQGAVEWLTNDAVNVVQISVAAALAMALEAVV